MRLRIAKPSTTGARVYRGESGEGEERPDEQVIVLSALPDVDTKVRCLDLGAADYITKPFSLTELIARVRRRVRQRAADGHQTPEHGDDGPEAERHCVGGRRTRLRLFDVRHAQPANTVPGSAPNPSETWQI